MILSKKSKNAKIGQPTGKTIRNMCVFCAVLLLLVAATFISALTGDKRYMGTVAMLYFCVGFLALTRFFKKELRDLHPEGKFVKADIPYLIGIYSFPFAFSVPLTFAMHRADWVAGAEDLSITLPCMLASIAMMAMGLPSLYRRGRELGDAHLMYLAMLFGLWTFFAIGGTTPFVQEAGALTTVGAALVVLGIAYTVGSLICKTLSPMILIDRTEYERNKDFDKLMSCMVMVCFGVTAISLLLGEAYYIIHKGVPETLTIFDMTEQELLIADAVFVVIEASAMWAYFRNQDSSEKCKSKA